MRDLNETATDPQPVIPTLLSRRKLQRWLALQGISVDNAINAIDDMAVKFPLHSAWLGATHFHRTDAFLTALAAVINLSDQQLDQAFIDGQAL